MVPRSGIANTKDHGKRDGENNRQPFMAGQVGKLSNQRVGGGLGLPNIQAKCDAFFVKYLTRILRKDCCFRDNLLY